VAKDTFAVYEHAPAALRVGAQAPPFDLPCTSPDGKRALHVRLSSFRGHWLVVLFYARDFAFLSPNELRSFHQRFDDFRKADCALLAISVDALDTHKRWLRTPVEEAGLGLLGFPLASDTSGETCTAYGVFDPRTQAAAPASFVVDPSGVIRHVSYHHPRVGRSVDETVRVLHALQSDQLCPADWKPGEQALVPLLDLGSGRVLGPYRLGREMGHGSFGRVFEAWDTGTRSRVALKVLLPGTAVEPMLALAEARKVAKIHHPHVGTIWEADLVEGVPSIAMEFIAGGSLADLISLGALNATRIRVLAAQSLAALAVSHARRIVHGDLKPANIMLDAGGNAKLVDFGIAQQTGESGKSKSAGGGESGDEAGGGQTVTLAYMAPELLSGAPVSPASDIFAFGLILYEMITGQRAFQAAGFVELLQLLQKPDHTPLADRLQPPHKELVRSCLAQDPADRPTAKTALARWFARK
jgi:eukaryotic-like serine/threonine-protein kinase